MTDLVAVVRGDQVLHVYAANGDGAAVELASLRLSDTNVDTIVAVVEGLRPFLTKQSSVFVQAAHTTTKRATKRATFKPGERAPAQRRQMAYDYVAAHPGATTREILNHLGLKATGSAQTHRLETAGLRYVVAKEGGRGRYGVYRWYVA